MSDEQLRESCGKQAVKIRKLTKQLKRKSHQVEEGEAALALSNKRRVTLTAKQAELLGAVQWVERAMEELGFEKNMFLNLATGIMNGTIPPSHIQTKFVAQLAENVARKTANRWAGPRFGCPPACARALPAPS
jgi:hypothetical protein